MYQVKVTKTFRKDTERCRKRGYDMELLKAAILLLAQNGSLPMSYRPHKLSGNYGGSWECHIKGGTRFRHCGHFGQAYFVSVHIVFCSLQCIISQIHKEIVGCKLFNCKISLSL